MLKPILILITLLTLCGCKSKFDKKLWIVEEDAETYPHRDKMVDDLVENHHLKGLTYHQLVDSVGLPNLNYQVDSGVYYVIKVDYGWDIDPVYSKGLFIKLNKDSIVTSVKIEEWKH